MLVRNAGIGDVDAVLQLFEESSHRLGGMTSIRADRKLVERRLQASEEAWSRPLGDEPEERDYLLVLVDPASGRVVGTSAIVAYVGFTIPFYSYRIGTTVHSSPKLGVYQRFRTLHLSNDYTGATEVASLFLHEDWLGGGNGRLLSLSRLLYLAEHPGRFNQLVFAEMRGFQREDGSSPFWDGLGHRFFSIPFPDAVRRAGSGSKQFISELMPRHPIYVDMLPEPAQEAIGRVHPSTAPARALLESEGFFNRGYVDIFDGGPTLEARLGNLRVVRESQVAIVSIDDGVPSDDPILVSTRGAETFRVTMTGDYRVVGHQQVSLRPETADLLGVESGDRVRIALFRAGPVL